MNLLGFLPDVLKTIGKALPIPGLSAVIDAIAPDKVAQLPPDQQVALQAELQKHEEAMRSLDIEEMKTFISESLAEINSADKYTSRARPTGVYAATAITAALAVGMICGAKVDTGAVIVLLAPLWGSAGYYTYNRTKEKLAAIGATPGGAS